VEKLIQFSSQKLKTSDWAATTWESYCAKDWCDSCLNMAGPGDIWDLVPPTLEREMLQVQPECKIVLHQALSLLSVNYQKSCLRDTRVFSECCDSCSRVFLLCSNDNNPSVSKYDHLMPLV
jgi:hypothetical protein